MHSVLTAKDHLCEVNKKRGFIQQISMFNQQYKYFKSKHTDTDINYITSKTLKNLLLLHYIYIYFFFF